MGWGGLAAARAVMRSGCGFNARRLRRAMRRMGAAGLGLSPPRFKRLLTIFLDFAGLFGLTASLLRHLRAIRQGWVTAAREK